MHFSELVDIFMACTRKSSALPWLVFSAVTVPLLVIADFSGPGSASTSCVFGGFAFGALMGIVLSSFLCGVTSAGENGVRRSFGTCFAPAFCLLIVIFYVALICSSNDSVDAGLLGFLEPVATYSIDAALGFPLYLYLLLRYSLMPFSVAMGVVFSVLGMRVLASAGLNVSKKIAGLSFHAIGEGPSVVVRAALAGLFGLFGLTRAYAWVLLLPRQRFEENGTLLNTLDMSRDLFADVGALPLVPVAICLALLVASFVLFFSYLIRGRVENCISMYAEVISFACLGELVYRAITHVKPELYLPTLRAAEWALVFQLLIVLAVFGLALLVCRKSVVGGIGHDTCSEQAMSEDATHQHDVERILAQAQRAIAHLLDGRGLSERECSVFCLTAYGLSSREIADALGLRPSTAREYASRARKKLDERIQKEAKEELGRLRCGLIPEQTEGKSGCARPSNWPLYVVTLAFVAGLVSVGVDMQFQHTLTWMSGLLLAVSSGAAIGWVLARLVSLAQLPLVCRGSWVKIIAVVSMLFALTLAVLCSPASSWVARPLLARFVCLLALSIAFVIIVAFYLLSTGLSRPTLVCFALCLFCLSLALESFWRASVSLSYVRYWEFGLACSTCVLAAYSRTWDKRCFAGSLSLLLVVCALWLGGKVFFPLLSGMFVFLLIFVLRGKCEIKENLTACDDNCAMSNPTIVGIWGTPLCLDLFLLIPMGLYVGMLFSNVLGGLATTNMVDATDHLYTVIVLLVAAFVVSIVCLVGALEADEKSQKLRGRGVEGKVESLCHILMGRGLSELQANTVIALSLGEDMVDIARKQSYSLNTIARARTEAYKVLGIHSRYELVTLVRLLARLDGQATSSTEH